MLDHIHRSPDELKTINGSDFETYRKAYKYCREIHDHRDNYFGDVVVPEPEEQFKDPPDKELQAHDWEELAAKLPNRPVETKDIDILGNRDIDLLHS